MSTETNENVVPEQLLNVAGEAENEPPNSSILSKTFNKLKDVTKSFMSQKEGTSMNVDVLPKVFKSPAKSRRTILTRKAVLNNIDQKSGPMFDQVASTPKVGHREILDASMSPITLSGTKRITVRKPEELNQMIAEEGAGHKSPIKTIRKTCNNNQVVVLEQVVISADELRNQVEANQDNPITSPIGIVQTDQVRTQKILIFN